MKESGKGPENLLAGVNPVREALRSGRPVDKVLLAQGERSGRTGEIMALARERGVPVLKVDRARLDALSGNSRHQGVLAYTAAREYSTVEQILDAAGDSPFILLLDEINDPHNLGAILRTAEAAGVHGVVIPRRRSVSLTPAVARVSAGAVEYVPVARVANLAQTMDMLKERGLWVVGADAGGPDLYWRARLDGPLVLVVGGEDKGLGRLVREKCDLLVRLPMAGRINSLNASVAAALLMYEVLRQRAVPERNRP
ncbi:MAG: 23S rRNA (guanosine(2251)-2'-O)-methyltransferase RlmB [Peptococcaceae bacterium]|nr:23S rRNA (guanosine(2251)-2'-O)-methyltransferase RlmB [Peptococcaceae bacterium]